MAPHHGFVLVVDDEDGIRETLSELVELVGCSARVARNGAEALALIEQDRPCLVILDLLMPVMSGHQLLEIMKQRPGLESIPVVISTSAPSRAPLGHTVVPKPINIEVIFELIRKSCECATPPAA